MQQPYFHQRPVAQAAGTQAVGGGDVVQHLAGFINTPRHILLQAAGGDQHLGRFVVGVALHQAGAHQHQALQRTVPAVHAPPQFHALEVHPAGHRVAVVQERLVHPALFGRAPLHFVEQAGGPLKRDVFQTAVGQRVLDPAPGFKPVVGVAVEPDLLPRRARAVA